MIPACDVVSCESDQQWILLAGRLMSSLLKLPPLLQGQTGGFGP